MSSRRGEKMATKLELPRLCLLALSLLLASASVALGKESDQCLAVCDGLKGDEDEYAACEKYCELNQNDRGPGKVSPRQEFERCQQRCQTEAYGREQLRKCQQRCQEKRREREREEHGEREREREREREHEGGQEERESREEEREREERQRKREEQQREREGEKGDRGRDQPTENREVQEQRHNPYYFHEQRFQSRFRSDEGHIRVLEKFSERSRLLRGLKNHRFSILEASPQTFVVPHHLDADSVLVVERGRATITLVWQEKRETRRESYNVERGDIMTVPAGTMFYVINHGNEKLQILKLVQSVNTPGEYKEYFVAGGRPRAYLGVFSDDVLKAALNIPNEQHERIFRQTSERQLGAIIRASQEQLRALSERATSTRRGGRGRRGPIKLESESPIYSNEFGRMYEVCPDDFPQLRNSDVAVAIIDVKQGGMMLPHYSSRATWVVFVSEGTGSFEMACPHIHGGEWRRETRPEEESHGRREEEKDREGSGQFERVTGGLTPGGVLIIPAGHPVAITASQNKNLRLVGFGINAENNFRNFLAGKESIMNEVEQEAKELAFNVEGKEADQIFRSQRESFFTQGPEGGRRISTEKKMSRPLSSILNFVV